MYRDVLLIFSCISVALLWMQVKLAHAGCRILACTPSNSAADLITLRLLKHIDKKDIIRLNALSRNWDSVDDEVKVSFAKKIVEAFLRVICSIGR